MTDSFLWLAPAGQFDNVTFQQQPQSSCVTHFMLSSSKTGCSGGHLG